MRTDRYRDTGIRNSFDIKTLDGILSQMHQGSYTTWNEQNDVCCKSDLAGEQENWSTSCQDKGGTHTARPWSTPHAAVAATYKTREQAALGSSSFGVALGWGGKGFDTMRVGKKSADRREKLIRGYNNRTGEPPLIINTSYQKLPTDCCAAAQLTAAAVLCPRCC